MQTMTDPENHVKPKVLVVEDDLDFRFTLQDWLELRGFEVATAEDGMVALDEAAEQAFDLVVTDLKMPRVDGLRLLSELKVRDPFVEVIFLSGQATIGDAIAALREGQGFDFLQKPLPDLDVLVGVMQKALQRRALNLQSAVKQENENSVSRILLDPLAGELADQPILREALDFVAARFRGSIGLSDVAKEVGYSPGYLTNLMRRKTGRTVQRWIIEFRLEEAKRLLLATEWSVNRIASIVGYSDPTHFHRQFRAVYKDSPQSWRQQATVAL